MKTLESDREAKKAYLESFFDHAQTYESSMDIPRQADEVIVNGGHVSEVFLNYLEEWIKSGVAYPVRINQESLSAGFKRMNYLVISTDVLVVWMESVFNEKMKGLVKVISYLLLHFMPLSSLELENEDSAIQQSFFYTALKDHFEKDETVKMYIQIIFGIRQQIGQFSSPQEKMDIVKGRAEIFTNKSLDIEGEKELKPLEYFQQPEWYEQVEKERARMRAYIEAAIDSLIYLDEQVSGVDNFELHLLHNTQSSMLRALMGKVPALANEMNNLNVMIQKAKETVESSRFYTPLRRQAEVFYDTLISLAEARDEVDLQEKIKDVQAALRLLLR